MYSTIRLNSVMAFRSARKSAVRSASTRVNWKEKASARRMWTSWVTLSLSFLRKISFSGP